MTAVARRRIAVEGAGAVIVRGLVGYIGGGKLRWSFPECRPQSAAPRWSFGVTAMDECRQLTAGRNDSRARRRLADNRTAPDRTVQRSCRMADSRQPATEPPVERFTEHGP